MNEIIKPEMTFDNALRFTPYAWAKLLYMRDKGDTEVAGYGITATPDPLLITNFVLVKAECTSVSFEFDPVSTVDHMERMMDQGLMPWQYANILIHTHPGNSPHPSTTDEDNFISAFSKSDWAIMFILAQGGDTYCRIKMNVGPGITKEMQVVIDYNTQFSGSKHEAWDKEYTINVFKIPTITRMMQAISPSVSPSLDYEFNKWVKSQVIEELDCYWDNEDECSVYYDTENGCYYTYSPSKKQWYQDDGSSNMVEIDTPNESWVTDVMVWTNKYGNTYELA